MTPASGGDRGFETLRVDVTGRIGYVTLCRPQKLNPLGRLTLRELVAAASLLDAERAVTVVIVRGEGRAFSSGFDLGDFAAPPEEGESLTDVADLGRVMAEAVGGMRAVTIASIQGHCVGGGLVLAAACDIRVASDDARFSIPEVDLGIPLAWGGIPRLVRELGPAVTMDLVLTCRGFDAAEAHSIRFVNRVVPNDRLSQETEALAELLSQKSPLVMRQTKQQVHAATEALLSTAGATADAFALGAAAADAESRAAAARYLEARAKRS
ncbi:MAG: enoyl-CoA hydratase/isomerase family protein [Acidimicrobiia bacterium]|nr:enoyl-CoA hydratase/isomerase family protein [Acidimicrobiia bacterium]